MGRYRVYAIEFKKQVVQEYLGGESLHGLGKRHQISRNLIRVWIAKDEAGEFDDDHATAAMLFKGLGELWRGPRDWHPLVSA